MARLNGHSPLQIIVLTSILASLAASTEHASSSSSAPFLVHAPPLHTDISIRGDGRRCGSGGEFGVLRTPTISAATGANVRSRHPNTNISCPVLRNLCGNSSSRESFAKSGRAKLTCGPQESLAAVATIITSLLPGSYIKCHHATKNAPTSLTTVLTHVPVHFRVIASVVTSVPSMLDRRRHPRFSPCGKGSGRRPPTGPWCAARRALAALWPRATSEHTHPRGQAPCQPALS